MAALANFLGIGSKSIADLQKAYDEASAAENAASDPVTKAELSVTTAKAKKALDDAQPASSGGRRKRRGGRHTKRHRPSRKGKSRKSRK
jgi:hypothetical protein